MGNLTIWDKNCLVLAYFEEKKVLCAVFYAIPYNYHPSPLPVDKVSLLI